MNPFSALDQAVRDLFSPAPRDPKKEDEVLNVEALEPRILYSAAPMTDAPSADRETVSGSADIRLIQEQMTDGAVSGDPLQPPSIQVQKDKE